MNTKAIISKESIEKPSNLKTNLCLFGGEIHEYIAKTTDKIAETLGGIKDAIVVDINEVQEIDLNNNCLVTDLL